MGGIRRSHYGEVEGRPVEAFELEGGDTRIQLISFGATLTRLFRPDRTGQLEDIVLGYDDPADYQANRGSAGAICGRYGNRIANARITLDGQSFALTPNEGQHHLHGGAPGFGRRFWRGEADEERNAVVFTIESPDGDQGYPGAFQASATYSLDAEGDLSIVMEATSDKPTMVNLLYHGYWNLAGHASGPVLDQHLRLAADRFTPIDANKIPTGERLSVEGTPFDFQGGKPIGQDIAAASPSGGYDHNLCIAGYDGSLKSCASAFDPASGRAIEIFSDQPGLQFYTANHLALKPVTGKGGVTYNKYQGFALETQVFPDSPNQPGFPSARLDPGQRYCHRMRVRFSTL